MQDGCQTENMAEIPWIFEIAPIGLYSRQWKTIGVEYAPRHSRCIFAPGWLVDGKIKPVDLYGGCNIEFSVSKQTAFMCMQRIDRVQATGKRDNGFSAGGQT